MGPSTVLLLVRHGQTSANLDGVWHGSTDTPLTGLGRLQAERVARYVAEKHPRVAAVYASPLQRARNTAEAIAGSLGLGVHSEPGLAEYDLGSWEGKSFRELYETHRLWDHLKRDPHFRSHGGESPHQVTERFGGALRRIAATHAGQRVVAVAHGGALSMALAQLIDGDYRRWRRVMDNCAVSELVLEPVPRLLSFNVREHLEDL